MNIANLAIANEGGVPLYSLPNGTRFKYIDTYYKESYTLVKHSEYEFPAHFLLRRTSNVLVYQYKIAIPESFAHQVIFIEDSSIVKVLEFP